MSGNGFQAYNAAPSGTLLEPGSSLMAVDQASSVGSNEGDSSRGRSLDPASSSFFSSDFKKHDDLRGMLEGNKDTAKLEAMRRLIAMVARNKDCSELFPSVVKNVVSKNSEVKKLVYVYLTRYAEEKQDLALLSISTFQRALKDPNQLIRASALRVLTSIRVPMILPIHMLAIKDSVSDMSAYVRKTAALAIPKIYDLDPDQKDQLIEIIEKLLADKTTLVVGCAIHAFEEVCPDRIDLIHKNYRKLCELLVDVEEWGQVVIINMLTRYLRTQFLDPKTSPDLDGDHMLLLRTVRPLFQSRNAAVVMAVSQLYYHCAPVSELSAVIRNMVRMIRASPEIQHILLTNLATLSSSFPSHFSTHLKSFYVRASDFTNVKMLKLEILTNLASESNISVLLREFQAYVSSADPDLAAATVQAIGRCASTLPETTDTCLSGLVHLLSKKDEIVVAESIVVIKKLLQMHTSDHAQMILHLARLVDNISIPRARASILWLIGEYCDRIPKIAPDVLRKFAKSFLEEEDQVKLQVLNLAAKLCVTNFKQTQLLALYVMNLAKYDQNYDIRDRSRFLRPLIFPAEQNSFLSKHVKKILLAPKPAPEVRSRFSEASRFQLGSLSHLLNQNVVGYQELSDWPTVQPDKSVRVVHTPDRMPDLFYREQRPVKTSASGSSSEDSDSDSSDAEDSSSSGSGSSEEESDSAAKKTKEVVNSNKKKAAALDKRVVPQLIRQSTSDTQKTSPVVSSSGDQMSSSGSESDDEEGSSSSTDTDVKKHPIIQIDAPSKPQPPQNKKKKKTAEPVVTSSNSLSLLDDLLLLPTPSKSYSLVNKYAGTGLEVNYTFPRTILSNHYIPVDITFTNHSSDPVCNLELKHLSGPSLQSFPAYTELLPGASFTAQIGVSWDDSTASVQFSIVWNGQSYQATIQPPVGELLLSVSMSTSQFSVLTQKLKGMSEHKSNLPQASSSLDESGLTSKLLRVANLVNVSSSDPEQSWYAGATCGSQTPLLLIVDRKLGNFRVHCETVTLGTLFHKEILAVLSSST